MNAQEAKRVEEIGSLKPTIAINTIFYVKVEQHDFQFLLDLVKRQEEEIGRLPCNGCKWSGMIRPQKCATCCRNKHMKDNYQEATP